MWRSEQVLLEHRDDEYISCFSDKDTNGGWILN